MKDQVLSIEKMQKLKELGVDASKASMAWYQDYDDLLDRSYSLYELTNFTKKLYNIPTFTYNDAINILPHYIYNKDMNKYYLFIDKKYICYEHIKLNPVYIYKVVSNNLNNVYNMLIWLAENKYI